MLIDFGLGEGVLVLVYVCSTWQAVMPTLLALEVCCPRSGANIRAQNLRNARADSPAGAGVAALACHRAQALLSCVLGARERSDALVCLDARHHCLSNAFRGVQNVLRTPIRTHRSVLHLPPAEASGALLCLSVGRPWSRTSAQLLPTRACDCLARSARSQVAHATTSHDDFRRSGLQEPILAKQQSSTHTPPPPSPHTFEVAVQKQALIHTGSLHH